MILNKKFFIFLFLSSINFNVNSSLNLIPASFENQDFLLTNSNNLNQLKLDFNSNNHNDLNLIPESFGQESVVFNVLKFNDISALPFISNGFDSNIQKFEDSRSNASFELPKLVFSENKIEPISMKMSSIGPNDQARLSFDNLNSNLTSDFGSSMFLPSVFQDNLAHSISMPFNANNVQFSMPSMPLSIDTPDVFLEIPHHIAEPESFLLEHYEYGVPKEYPDEFVNIPLPDGIDEFAMPFALPDLNLTSQFSNFSDSISLPSFLPESIMDISLPSVVPEFNLPILMPTAIMTEDIELEDWFKKGIKLLKLNKPNDAAFAFSKAFEYRKDPLKNYLKTILKSNAYLMIASEQLAQDNFRLSGNQFIFAANDLIRDFEAVSWESAYSIDVYTFAKNSYQKEYKPFVPIAQKMIDGATYLRNALIANSSNKLDLYTRAMNFFYDSAIMFDSFNEVVLAAHSYEFSGYSSSKKAEYISDIKNKALAYECSGDYYRISGKRYKSVYFINFTLSMYLYAVDKYYKSIDLYEVAPRLLYQKYADTNKIIGDLYYIKENYIKSIEYYKEAIWSYDIAKEIIMSEATAQMELAVQDILDGNLNTNNLEHTRSIESSDKHFKRAGNLYLSAATEHRKYSGQDSLKSNQDSDRGIHFDATRIACIFASDSYKKAERYDLKAGIDKFLLSLDTNSDIEINKEGAAMFFDHASNLQPSIKISPYYYEHSVVDNSTSASLYKADNGNFKTEGLSLNNVQGGDQLKKACETLDIILPLNLNINRSKKISSSNNELKKFQEIELYKSRIFNLQSDLFTQSAVYYHDSSLYNEKTILDFLKRYVSLEQEYKNKANKHKDNIGSLYFIASDCYKYAREILYALLYEKKLTHFVFAHAINDTYPKALEAYESAFLALEHEQYELCLSLLYSSCAISRALFMVYANRNFEESKNRISDFILKIIDAKKLVESKFKVILRNKVLNISKSLFANFKNKNSIIISVVMIKEFIDIISVFRLLVLNSVIKEILGIAQVGLNSILDCIENDYDIIHQNLSLTAAADAQSYAFLGHKMLTSSVLAESTIANCQTASFCCYAISYVIYLSIGNLDKAQIVIDAANKVFN